MTFKDTVEAIGKTIDGIGVGAIVLGVLVATWVSVRRSREPDADLYGVYRQQLGRAILLGLELLVAADIVRTVAVKPTLESAGVLGIIVVIRTQLSFSLEAELHGRNPMRARPRGVAEQ